MKFSANEIAGSTRTRGSITIFYGVIYMVHANMQCRSVRGLIKENGLFFSAKPLCSKIEHEYRSITWRLDAPWRPRAIKIARISHSHPHSQSASKKKEKQRETICYAASHYMLRAIVRHTIWILIRVGTKGQNGEIAVSQKLIGCTLDISAKCVTNTQKNDTIPKRWRSPITA